MITLENFEIKDTKEDALKAQPRWSMDRISNRLKIGQKLLIAGSTTIAASGSIPEWEAIALKDVETGKIYAMSMNVLTGTYFFETDLMHVPACPLSKPSEVLDAFQKIIVVTSVEKVRADVYGTDNKVVKIFYGYTIEDGENSKPKNKGKE
jgi:hypothetical protein